MIVPDSIVKSFVYWIVLPKLFPPVPSGVVTSRFNIPLFSLLRVRFELWSAYIVVPFSAFNVFSPSKIIVTSPSCRIIHGSFPFTSKLASFNLLHPIYLQLFELLNSMFEL